MINRVTDGAEILGCLAMAAGAGWNVAEHLGVGWGLIAFGAVILLMSAWISLATGWRKAGAE